LAKAKAKASPKRKATSAKKRPKLEDVISEIKKINERLDKVESDILALRGIAQPQTVPSKEEAGQQ
jgi:hypothetical protein